MTRNLVRILLAALLAMTTWIVLPRPGQASTARSHCPAMTDSITRLYLAFFERKPDDAGFRYWVETYASGEASLTDIADQFARSDEFGARRFFSNEAYVDWLYEEVLGPDVTIERQGYWVEALDAGYPRGAVALAFTESWEYVQATDTAMPLAGYLRWYPRGTHWYCNIGSVAQTVQPLRGEVWADYYFRNRGEQATAVELWTVEANGQRHIRMAAETVQANHTDYNWDGEFSGDGSYGDAIEVVAGAETDWIVVFYPRSLGPDRLGWQLD